MLITYNSRFHFHCAFGCGRQKQVSCRDFIWETPLKIATFFLMRDLNYIYLYIQRRTSNKVELKIKALRGFNMVLSQIIMHFLYESGRKVVRKIKNIFFSWVSHTKSRQDTCFCRPQPNAQWKGNWILSFPGRYANLTSSFFERRLIPCPCVYRDRWTWTVEGIVARADLLPFPSVRFHQ